MTKRIEQNGKFYRMRRGKLVEIPAQWTGQAVTSQTIRKRRSQHTPAQRSEQSHPGRSGEYFTKQYRELKRTGI